MKNGLPAIACQTPSAFRCHQQKRDSHILSTLNSNEKCLLRSKLDILEKYNQRLAASAAGSHDHSKLWTIERAVSAGLLALIPASFWIPYPIMNYALALSLVVHVHWGVEAIVVDYIRPALFGEIIPKGALALTYLLSIVALGGLFYFNYTDVGLVQAIRMIAKL